MGQSGRQFRLAIIGGGPRGLAALEAIAVRAAADGVRVEVTVFEAHSSPGAGPHHDPAQPKLNRLNIARRSIDIEAAGYPGAAVGSFAQWAEQALFGEAADDYPSRRDLGRFLQTRWHDLLDNAPTDLGLDLVRAHVTGLRRSRSGWSVIADEKAHDGFDEVLMTLGHQPAEDPQIATWQKHAARSGAMLMPAYPSNLLLDAARGWRERTVAIRGLGLSTIDVMRLLTVGLGGQFEPAGDRLVYRRSASEPVRLLPFSLNGIPPTPKPATARIDAAFDIGEVELDDFERALLKDLGTHPDSAVETIRDRLSALSGAVLDRVGHSRGATRAREWIEAELSDDGQPADQRPPATILADQLAMALGERQPDAGYAIGQVWRKLQTPLRRAYNTAAVEASAAERLVAFDEGLKRYSYGPPATAAREMLALIKAGVVDLRAVDDPDVAMVKDGWRLSVDEGEASASVMIDAVLPGPTLKRVSGAVIAGLRDEGLLVGVGDKLGARTLPDARVIGSDGVPVAGLALLGRLALGSVVATDSVHDCFGAAVGRYADGLVARAKAVQA